MIDDGVRGELESRAGRDAIRRPDGVGLVLGGVLTNVRVRDGVLELWIGRRAPRRMDPPEDGLWITADEAEQTRSVLEAFLEGRAELLADL